MKTIKEVAEMCGMSKTSVNRAIEELNIEKTLSGNKNLVSDKDADRIVSLLRGFGKDWEEVETNQNKSTQNQNKSEENETETETPKNSVISETLKNNEFLINFLMDQIKVKDNQISELQEENRMLIQAQAFTVKQLEKLTNPELIQEQQQEKTSPEPAETEPKPAENNAGPQEKKSFFSFFRHK